MKKLTILLICLVSAINLLAQDFTGKAIEDYTKLQQMIKDNRFDASKIDGSLYDVGLLKTYVENKNGVQKSVLNVTEISGGLSDILPPNIIIDGIGTFVSGRIKEEANIAYLNRFTIFIENSPSEIQLLLPNTKNKLLDVKEEIYDYKNYFPSLRNQFKKDFENTPQNLVTLFEDTSTFTGSFWDNAKINSTTKPYFAFTFDIINGFSQSIKPLAFLENIRNRQYFKTILATPKGQSDNEKQILLLITDLAFHLNPSNSAVNLSKITDAFSLECIAKLVIASKQNNSVKLKSMTDLALIKILNSLVSMSASKNNFNNFITNFNAITQAISLRPSLNGPFKYLSTSTKIIEAIQTKDNHLLANGIIDLTKDLISSSNSNNSTLEKARKFLTFMANVINAKDGNDMLAALQAAALPVRSYQMKRNSTFVASFGALGGLAYRGASDNTGIYAPIGFDLAVGRLGNRKGGNLSLSIPLIDVSAVTALRLLGNKDVLPSLVWDNVFAPGFLVNWGIRNQPITLSAGWQKGPGLIEIKNNQAIIKERTGTFVIGASFDIPIFNIYNRR